MKNYFCKCCQTVCDKDRYGVTEGIRKFEKAERAKDSQKRSIKFDGNQDINNMEIRKEDDSSKIDISFIKEKETADWSDYASDSQKSREKWKGSEGFKAEGEEGKEKVEIEDGKDPIRQERRVEVLMGVFGEFGEYERIEWHL